MPGDPCDLGVDVFDFDGLPVEVHFPPETTRGDAIIREFAWHRQVTRIHEEGI
ncbi:MAG: hypothetical protein WC277_02045 [Bacilli bacterium]